MASHSSQHNLLLRQHALHQRLLAVEEGVRLATRWRAVFERLAMLEQGSVCMAASASQEAAQIPAAGPDHQPAAAAPAAAKQTAPGPRPAITLGASPTQQRLEQELIDKGFSACKFARVPANYYDQDLEYRRACVGAESIDCLTKSIIMENTRAHSSVEGCSNPHNSKYYLVIVQYTARLNPEKLHKWLHKLNEGKIGKQFFNMRLAPEAVSDSLSGFTHNAVTPIAIATPLPIIISHRVLEQVTFFLGAGEVDLKVGLLSQEFVSAYQPFVVDCTY